MVARHFTASASSSQKGSGTSAQLGVEDDSTTCCAPTPQAVRTLKHKVMPLLAKVTSPASSKSATPRALTVIDTGSQLLVQNDAIPFKVTFEKSRATFTSFEYKGQHYIHGGVAPNIWRAPTDNDEGGPVGEWPPFVHSIVHFLFAYFGFLLALFVPRILYNIAAFAKRWRFNRLDRPLMLLSNFEYQETPEGTVAITTTSNLRTTFDTIIYKANFVVHESGVIDVAASFDLSQVQGLFPGLPRVGVQLLLPQNFSQYGWYGRGPHENYPDRLHSAMIGVYRSSVQDQHYNYIRPQETGNRCGVRWSEVRTPEGQGWRATATATPFNASISPYSQDNLTASLHVNELKPAGYTTWNLDAAQMGVGGDVSWLPSTHPEFLLREKAYSVAFTLTPS